MHSVREAWNLIFIDPTTGQRKNKTIFVAFLSAPRIFQSEEFKEFYSAFVHYIRFFIVHLEVKPTMHVMCRCTNDPIYSTAFSFPKESALVVFIPKWNRWSECVECASVAQPPQRCPLNEICCTGRRWSRSSNYSKDKCNARQLLPTHSYLTQTAKTFARFACCDHTIAGTIRHEAHEWCSFFYLFAVVVVFIHVSLFRQTKPARTGFVVWLLQHTLQPFRQLEMHRCQARLVFFLLLEINAKR